MLGTTNSPGDESWLQSWCICPRALLLPQCPSPLGGASAQCLRPRDGDCATHPRGMDYIQYEVEALLRPETYPTCDTVMDILRRWNGFAYSAQGYRDAVPMPTGDTNLTLLDDSWDSPTEDFSALEESTDSDTPRPGADSGEEQASNLTLDE